MSENTVEEATSSRGRLRWMLVGAVVVAVAAAAWWFLLGPASAEEVIPDEDGEIVALEPMTTTVGKDGVAHARVAVAVVLTVPADPSVVEPREALLYDALLREVSALGASELRGSEGSEGLRQRLSAAAREIWGEDVVRRVVLTELLVQ